MSRTHSGPARSLIPTINITRASKLSQAEQPVINQQGSSADVQSQGSHSVIDSEDYGSFYTSTPSDNLSILEENHYHPLDNDDWHTGPTENLERKPKIEESFEELTLPLHGKDVNNSGCQPVVEIPRILPAWPMRYPEEPLQDRIYRALEGNDQITRGFFPAKSLSRILNEETVYMELLGRLSLDTYDRDEIWTMAQKVCGTSSVSIPGVSFQKIFAILVMIEKTAAIVKFLDQDVNDSDLPLEAYYPPSKKLVSELRRSKAKDGKVEIKLFRAGRTTGQMINFEEKQWTTLAPIFKRSDEDKVVSHYTSSSGKIPLPFLKCVYGEGVFEFEGGGGRVSKVRIHPDHHSFHYTYCPLNASTPEANISIDPATHSMDICPCHFAIKKLHSSPAVFKQFKSEVDVLRRFSNEKNKHLISLLATYEHSGNYYLIFPLAKANLRTYWQEIHPNPRMNRSTVLWVAKQCQGIAYGVSAIHQYRSGNWSNLEARDYKNAQFGHHGDIKPENILWFQDGHGSSPDPSGFQAGTFTLTDFGLAAINTDRTISRNLVEFPCSRDYSAPEADLMNCGPPGRQYDMWTLGCVYLEIVTWMIGGWSLLEEFTRSRSAIDHQPFWTSLGIKTATFFELQFEGLGMSPERITARVKPQVTKVTTSCSSFISRPSNFSPIHRFTGPCAHVVLT
ncbi:kinase-like domain-containing protein [Neurospora crassa]|nr:kinase-like domain-containing protein [Neurospora crassa]